MQAEISDPWIRCSFRLSYQSVAARGDGPTVAEPANGRINAGRPAALMQINPPRNSNSPNQWPSGTARRNQTPSIVVAIDQSASMLVRPPNAQIKSYVE